MAERLPHARVRRTSRGWVAILAGGSVSKPFPTWALAYGYALGMTRLFRDYWHADRDPRG